MDEEPKMEIETLTYKYMQKVISDLIQYFEKGSLPKEQEVFKNLIIKEFFIIQMSLSNVIGLIEKLREQLETMEKEK